MPDSFDLPWSDDTWVDLTVTFASGDQEDYTDQASFRSMAPAIATQSGPETTAAAIGDTDIEGFVSVEGNNDVTCVGLEGCDIGPIEAESDTTVVPRILMGLDGASPRQDITGSTEDVVVGEQVQLEASYALGESEVVDRQDWAADAAAIGGWNPGTTTTGEPESVPSGSGSTTLYWTAAGTGRAVEFDLTYTDSNGDEGTASAQGIFAVAGPTNVAVANTSGTWQVATDTKGDEHLVFGGTSDDIGITWTPSGSTPPGLVNSHFVWAQTLTDYEVDITNPAGTEKCRAAAYPALDNGYPYSAFMSPGVPDDDPGTDLTVDAANFPNASQVSLTIAARMYLLWNSGLDGAIEVPVGSGTWAASGTATYNHGWAAQPGTGGPAPFSFTSPTYPSWSGVFVNGALGCGESAAAAAHGRPKARRSGASRQVPQPVLPAAPPSRAPNPESER